MASNNRPTRTSSNSSGARRKVPTSSYGTSRTRSSKPATRTRGTKP